MIYDVLGWLVREPAHVRTYFGTGRNHQAERRFQKELREATRRLPLSTFHQCGTRPFFLVGRLASRDIFDGAGLATEARVFVARRWVIDLIGASGVSKRRTP